MNPWILPASAFALFAGNEIANPRRALLGKILWRGDGQGVALTFDDGPHPASTPQVLEVLDRFKVQAAFFVIGRHVAAHGRLVSQAARAGHVIGNHTFNHCRKMNFFSMEKLRHEVAACQKEVESWAGYRPRFYRQPTGFRNPNIFRILRQAGMSMVGWQARAFDTQRKEPRAISSRILARARPGGIILLHDGGDSPANDDRSATVKALPVVIQGLRDRGCEFLPLDGLLGLSRGL